MQTMGVWLLLLPAFIPVDSWLSVVMYTLLLLFLGRTLSSFFYYYLLVWHHAFSVYLLLLPRPILAFALAAWRHATRFRLRIPLSTTGAICCHVFNIRPGTLPSSFLRYAFSVRTYSWNIPPPPARLPYYLSSQRHHGVFTTFLAF